MFGAEDKVSAVLLTSYLTSSFSRGERSLPIGKGGKSITKRGLKSRIGEEAGKPGTAAVMNSGL